jgi:hypothetical protein
MVYDVVKNLKNKRAPGEDGISAELIKRGGQRLWKEIYELIPIIWNTKDFPEDWRTASIRPIHKKGSKLIYNNYRGISLLYVTYKIFTTILTLYIEPFAKNILREYQCGFHKGHSIMDHIFKIQQVLEKCSEQNKNIHQLYIDFQQAFDSINIQFTYEAMAEFRILSKLISLTKITLAKTNNKVKTQNKLSDSFMINTGMRQEDFLSTILFNITLDCCLCICCGGHMSGNVFTEPLPSNRHLLVLIFWLSVNMSHCSIIKVAQPEQLTGAPPLLIF